MTCPKCERGTIKKVLPKTMGEKAYLCDFCEMFWLEKEEIKTNTGHPFDATSQENAIEYTLEPETDKDPEDTSIMYRHAK